VVNHKDRHGYEIFAAEGHGLSAKMDWWMISWLLSIGV